MTILFSPIGGTDPISNLSDGAMLHICRHYQPDQVYLYMSKEMCAFHDQDNRYVYCLEQLGQLMNHHFEWHIIRKDELEDVQIFDAFIGEFRQTILDILDQNAESKIIVNVSSGTPAMKSALLMLSVLYPGKIMPIQVATPEKRMNPHDEDKYHYDAMENWSVNMDNEADAPNRCSLATSRNWMLEIKKEIAIRQIMAYDYVAALLVLSDEAEGITVSSMNLVKAAACRLKLDFAGMGRCLKDESVDFLPVKDGISKNLVEYTLGLQIKLKKEEYGDFIRAISPLLKDLYDIILKEECKLDVENDLAGIRKKGTNKTEILYWKKSKVDNFPEVVQALLAEYGQVKYGQEISNAAYSTLIIRLCKNSSVVEMTEQLRSVEKEVRNLAAHNIVSITDKKILKLTGLHAQQILDIIKTLLGMYVIRNKKQIWQSYDLMNEVLIERLKS